MTLKVAGVNITNSVTEEVLLPPGVKLMAGSGSNFLRKFGPLAHLVEHHTFNVGVAGSSPARLTMLMSATVVI